MSQKPPPKIPAIAVRAMLGWHKYAGGARGLDVSIGVGAGAAPEATSAVPDLVGLEVELRLQWSVTPP